MKQLLSCLTLVMVMSSAQAGADEAVQSESSAPSPAAAPSAAPQPDPYSPDQKCALQKILEAQKMITASRYGNSKLSHHVSPQAIHLALEKVHVRIKTGDAINYKNNLPAAGFIDISSTTDLAHAPPGAISVFAGPNSEQYLRDHWTAKMLASNKIKNKGDYFGDISMKGDDERFYSDHVSENAGPYWKGANDMGSPFKLAGIFIPGPDLAKHFAGLCK